ncbi:MAG: GNAT family N-acetyltransferase, partial [Planctomycetales bacterium]|nr:GNAT family N-acetyltransferase [Planctomycetales bacterium]
DGGATRLLGTVALGQRGSPGPHARATVHWLAVRSDDRGRGVARLLMATLEHACWQRGQRRIHLETHTGWGAALRLYESLGYQRGT